MTQELEDMLHEVQENRIRIDREILVFCIQSCISIAKDHLLSERKGLERASDFYFAVSLLYKGLALVKELERL